jgi:hypothetical protein
VKWQEKLYICGLFIFADLQPIEKKIVAEFCEKKIIAEFCD